MFIKTKAKDSLAAMLTAAARIPPPAEIEMMTGRSLWSDARRRFWRNKAAVLDWARALDALHIDSAATSAARQKQSAMSLLSLKACFGGLEA